MRTSHSNKENGGRLELYAPDVESTEYDQEDVVGVNAPPTSGPGLRQDTLRFSA